MTAPPDDTTEGKALPETMLQPCSFDDSPEPTTAPVTAEGLHALADEIRKCRKLLDLAEHSEALTKRRACTCEKSTSPYDGPSGPAEDCPRHGNPAVTAPLDDAVSLTDEDRDRIGRQRIAYIRAGCVCDRTVPAADFVPVPGCPIHGHVPSTDIAEDLRERLIAVIKSVRIHPKLDSAVTAMIMAGAGFHITDDEAGPLADAVLAALAGDPGDLPARMAEAMRRHTNTRDALETCTCGERVIDWDEHLAAVAMSVVQEHAARQAAEVERLRAELKRICRAMVETYGEDYGGEDVAAEVERLMRHLCEYEADTRRIIAAKNEGFARAEAERDALTTELGHVQGTLTDARTKVEELTRENREQREEIRRLAQATTEETNDG